MAIDLHGFPSILGKRRRLLVAVLLLLLLGGQALAHTFWLTSHSEGARLLLGDAADQDAYEEDDILEYGALDEDGNKAAVDIDYAHGRAVFKAPQAHMLWARVDYGYWHKTIRGWQSGGKSGGDSLESAHYFQFPKLEKNWRKPVTLGLEIEIVLDAVNSESANGRVLRQGKPAAGIAVYTGHKKIARTGKDGTFKAKRGAGELVLSASVVEPLANDPAADTVNYTAVYTLGVQP